MRLLLILMLLSIPNFAVAEQPSCEEMLKNYNYNPFQWIYPEHFYKAYVIEISPEKKISDDYYEIEFFGLKTYVPKEYHELTEKKTESYIGFKSESETGFFISINNDNTCYDETKGLEKEICSAYKSSREYYHKNFTMTPEMLNPDVNGIGDYWLVHWKRNFFKDINNSLKLYKGKNFDAYVKISKSNDGIGEIIIFHDSIPDGKYLSVSVNVSDMNFFKEFLSSLK